MRRTMSHWKINDGDECGLFIWSHRVLISNSKGRTVNRYGMNKSKTFVRGRRMKKLRLMDVVPRSWGVWLVVLLLGGCRREIVVEER